MLSILLQKEDTYKTLASIRIQCFGTLPVVGIVVMYIGLLWTVQKKKSRSMTDDGINGCATNLATDSQNAKMTLLVRKVVVMLLVCYLPFLVWRQYFYIEILGDDHPDSLSIREGVIDATVRMLLGINSCINPVIYAQTIPAFRELIRGYIYRST